MAAAQLAKIFHERYHSAKDGHRVTSIHFFGIEFADDLRGHTIKDICVAADVPVSYVTEVYKGMPLSELVKIKT